MVVFIRQRMKTSNENGWKLHTVLWNLASVLANIYAWSLSITGKRKHTSSSSPSSSTSLSLESSLSCLLSSPWSCSCASSIAYYNNQITKCKKFIYKIRMHKHLSTRSIIKHAKIFYCKCFNISKRHLIMFIMQLLAWLACCYYCCWSVIFSSRGKSNWSRSSRPTCVDWCWRLVNNKCASRTESVITQRKKIVWKISLE